MWKNAVIQLNTQASWGQFVDVLRTDLIGILKNPVCSFVLIDQLGIMGALLAAMIAKWIILGYYFLSWNFALKNSQQTIEIQEVPERNMLF